MTRLVHRSIEVECGDDGGPRRFRDGSQVYSVVEVIDDWREMGAWWRGHGERSVWRVLTEDDYVFEIECRAGQWRLYRVWD